MTLTFSSINQKTLHIACSVNYNIVRCGLNTHLLIFFLFTLFSDVDIDPHLPDIARELGWKNARTLALRTGISVATTESYEMEYRYDAEERTLQLLFKWVEKEGRQASKKLIENLVDMKQKKKAKQIRDILLKHSSLSNNPASNC